MAAYLPQRTFVPVRTGLDSVGFSVRMTLVSAQANNARLRYTLLELLHTAMPQLLASNAMRDRRGPGLNSAKYAYSSAAWCTRTVGKLSQLGDYLDEGCLSS